MKIKIRRATIDEFKKLWKYSETQTYKYFLSNLINKNIEFWTVDNNGTLIGELYIFWDSEDKDEANGLNRAYLCAYRIQKEYQGKGIGSKLMKRVIVRVKERGFTELTIGIDNDDYMKLAAMYNHFGFTTQIKEKKKDDHYLDENGIAVEYDETYKLVMSDLLDRTNVLVYIYSENPFKVLTLRRNESPIGIWQPVSGGVEDGEKLIDTVKREVYEETGIEDSLKITDLNYNFTFYVPSTKRVMKDYCFAYKVNPNTDVKISNEHDKYQWLDYEEAQKILEFDENKKALDLLMRKVSVVGLE